MKRFTANVDYDKSTNEYIIPLPDEMLSSLGWEAGDVLVWHDNKNGTYSITKKQEPRMKELFLVETVSIFRHRYVVKAETLEHAYDTVVMNEAKEIGQKHIDENIVSGRPITENEFISIFDDDNDYLKSISNTKKLDYITIVDYEK